MGKRLIIKGADFSENGMQENYTEHEVTTEQGLINATLSDEGRTLTGTTAASYSLYVHSNQSIILHPGETIAIVERPESTTRACIFAYTEVTSIYPALVCNSGFQNIGTPINGWGTSEYNGAHNDTRLPRILKNTSDVDYYIALQVNNPDGITPTSCPKIAYRIYS